MRTAYLILIGLLLISSSTAAQDFFPLQVGNKWVYEVTERDIDGAPIITYYRVTEVVSDSSMPNDSTYYILKSYPDEIFGSIVRTDSKSIYFYADLNNQGAMEYEVFRFDSTLWSQWELPNGFVQVDYEGEGTTFDEVTFSRGFNFGGLIFASYIFSKKVGLTYYHYQGDYVPFPNIDYVLKGCIINDTTYGNISSVEKISDNVPDDFQLHPAFPNPFNPETNIQFSVMSRTDVTLTVYDLLGRAIDVLHQGQVEPGVYQSKWRPAGLNSGVYILRLQTPRYARPQKILYVR